MKPYYIPKRKQQKDTGEEMATSEQSVQQGPTGNIMEIKFDPLRFINRMVLILLLSTSILSNEIRITQLNYETGYTILKKEKLDVIQDFSKVYHIIDLTDYENIKTKLNIAIENLNNTFQNNKSTTNLMFTLKIAQSKLISIKPLRIRQKRALANIVGKGLKRFIWYNG
ncbi:uncharacterized protein LOC110119011 isoform X2 [Ceratitis capitata]|uniref:uncharacterized protein LOC110119011 isoform X2 n=1 Tax=Ceratitis capitata TaxID=7213 RepID=UPI000C6C8322|nr:uncharacterized protein LOC110119011 isoform X2 [Ceratitis capitata]